MVQGEVEIKENLGTRRIPNLRMAKFPSADDIVRDGPFRKGAQDGQGDVQVGQDHSTAFPGGPPDPGDLHGQFLQPSDQPPLEQAHEADSENIGGGSHPHNAGPQISRRIH